MGIPGNVPGGYPEVLRGGCFQPWACTACQACPSCLDCSEKGPGVVRRAGRDLLLYKGNALAEAGKTDSP